MPIGEFDAGHANFEITLMLEEVQVSVALGPRIVDGMGSLYVRACKLTSFLEVDADCQELFAGVKAQIVDEPGLGDTECSSEDGVVHDGRRPPVRASGR